MLKVQINRPSKETKEELLQQSRNRILYTLFHIVIDSDDVEYITQNLIEEYKKLEINIAKTEYLNVRGSWQDLILKNKVLIKN